MDIGLIIAIVIAVAGGVLSFLLFVGLVVVSILLGLSVRSAFTLQEQVTEYSVFFGKISEILEDDIKILKGSLAKKLSADIPEVAEMQRGLTTLQNDIFAVKKAIREMELRGGL